MSHKPWNPPSRNTYSANAHDIAAYPTTTIRRTHRSSLVLIRHSLKSSWRTSECNIGYWRDPDDFDVWFERHGAAWAAGAGAENIGTFTEIVRPAAERFETLFSSNTSEGVANLARGFSDLVQEHAYWGGARDRIRVGADGRCHPFLQRSAKRLVCLGKIG